jgi:hypothetical protein
MLIYYDISKIDITLRSITDRINRSIVNEDFQKMISSGNRFISHDKARASLIAQRQLEQSNVKIPDRLVFANRVVSRIEDALTVTTNEDRDKYASQILPTMLGMYKNPKNKSRSVIAMKDKDVIMSTVYYLEEEKITPYYNCKQLTYPLIQSHHDPYLMHIRYTFPLISANEQFSSINMPYENLSKIGWNVSELETIVTSIFKSANPTNAMQLFFDATQPPLKVKQAVETYVNQILSNDLAAVGASFSPKVLFTPKLSPKNENIIVNLFDTITSESRSLAGRVACLDSLLFRSFNVNKCTSTPLPF